MTRRKKSPEMQKQSKSIHLENWIWDMTSHLDPCRSTFIKNLVLEKMKQDLVKKGLIEQDANITQEHAELYLTTFEEKQLYRLCRVSSFN